jgi:broad specificity phosphatase PhoE
MGNQPGLRLPAPCSILFLSACYAERHPTDDARSEPTELGRRGAQAVREALGQKFDLVLAAPATRTVRTAAIVAQLPDKEVLQDDMLYWRHFPSLGALLQQVPADLPLSRCIEVVGEALRAHAQ